MECQAGSLWARSACIFGYNGQINDIVMNYAVLVVNTVYCMAAVSHHQIQKEEFRRFAWLSLIGVVIFQWTLCLLLGCSGISIVWCAMGGWTMEEQQDVVSGVIDSRTPSERQDIQNESNSSLLSLGSRRLRDWGTVVILVDISTIVYYAVVMEPITTVAHICALMLGGALSRISIRLCSSSSSSSATDYVSGQRLLPDGPSSERSM